MLLHYATGASHRGLGPLAVSAQKALRSDRDNLLTAFSLANLCFINVWYLCEQIPATSLNYYRKTPADMTLLWATLICVLLLGAGFRAGWAVVKKWGNPLAVRFAKGFFLIVLSYPVEKLIRYLSPPPDQFSYGFSIALIALETTLLMGVMLVVLFDRPAVFRTARQCTTVLALLFPSLVINLSWGWLSGPSAAAFVDRPLAAPAKPHQPAVSRVVWMIFDEFDQGLAFDHRPAGLPLPNLDRMRQSSFYADHVYPTARWTMLAMPALINGRAVSRAELLNESDLRIWHEGSEQPEGWRAQANIFSRSRAAGRNSAMIGWHHPYCRVLNESLSACHWVGSEQGSDEIETEFHAKRKGLLRSVLFLLEWKAEDLLSALNIRFASRAGAAVQHSLREGQLERFLNIREHAMAAAADPSLDLVLIHWPTPHPYGIYDRAKGVHSVDPNLSYLDNLALVDRTVGEVMATAGSLAGPTVFLVSSDHPFRREMWEGKFRWTEEMTRAVDRNRVAFVPFLARFGQGGQAVSYQNGFNAILTTEIVESIMQGAIRSETELAAWLDRNRSRVPLE